MAGVIFHLLSCIIIFPHSTGSFSSAFKHAVLSVIQNENHVLFHSFLQICSNFLNPIYGKIVKIVQKCCYTILNFFFPFSFELVSVSSLYIYHSNNVAFVKVTISVNYVTSTHFLWHPSIRSSSYRSQLIEMCAGLEPQAADRACICLMGASSSLHHQTEKVLWGVTGKNSGTHRRS